MLLCMLAHCKGFDTLSGPLNKMAPVSLGNFWSICPLGYSLSGARTTPRCLYCNIQYSLFLVGELLK